MEDMLKELSELIVKNASELIVFGATTLVALIKRKIDLRKIRRRERKLNKN